MIVCRSCCSFIYLRCCVGYIMNFFRMMRFLMKCFFKHEMICCVVEYLENIGFLFFLLWRVRKVAIFTLKMPCNDIVPNNLVIRKISMSFC